MVDKESNNVEASEDEEALMKEEEEEDEPRGVRGGCCYWFWGPIYWLKMLADETRWSFVFGVLVVNGVSQGLGGAFSRIGVEYYMKDVQKVQPSESQIYQGIMNIPWFIKPIWGLFTDVLPILGYRRRPYLIFSGLFGVVSMLLLSLHEKLHLLFAVLSLTASSTSVAIADVTVDACVTENSISHPSLAPDMQSLCALSEAAGALVGYFIGGVLVHLIGPQGVFGLLTIPAVLVLLVGILLDEPFMPNFAYSQATKKLIDAGKAMWMTLKIPDVWRPSLYMYISISVSVNIQEGLFYWYTDSEGGPSFSQETVGFILSIGSVGSLLGAILYQNFLKNHPFRELFFWSQLLFGLSGLLDLVLVLRLNLKLGMPDYLFAVVDECVSQLIARLKWMPILVLSSKLCPPGIEGTFFALLMSIENLGGFTSSWGGGLLLHVLNVTRTKFDNLWLVILMRTILRVSPLSLLFLVPRGDQNASVLPDESLVTKEETGDAENENMKLVALVSSVIR